MGSSTLNLYLSWLGFFAQPHPSGDVVEELDDQYQGITARLVAVSVALAERDVVTRIHCDHVRGLALDVGRACALSERDLHVLGVAAGFHDVGKIGIPDAVLKKPGKLTAADWVVMKTHPGRSDRIVAAAGLSDGERIAAAIRHHHERFDGAGYPDGLAGERIPPLARIVAVVDAYDAMAAARHYGGPRTHAEILAELQLHEGRQHDPYIVKKFLSIIETNHYRVN